MGTKFRHEWKHEITYSDRICIRQRLRAIAGPDPHAINGIYEIRSLYFDNLYDKALREKVDGVNRREKFRIRYYNGNTDYITLEKKSKLNGLCRCVPQARGIDLPLMGLTLSECLDIMVTKSTR